MPRLVEAKLVTARERYLRHTPPRLFLNGAGRNAFALQVGDRRFYVVAHQVQLVEFVPLGWMDRQLGRRRGEDEPTATSIYGWKVQHVPKECTRCFVFLRVDQCVHTDDRHGYSRKSNDGTIVPHRVDRLYRMIEAAARRDVLVLSATFHRVREARLPDARSLQFVKRRCASAQLP